MKPNQTIERAARALAAHKRGLPPDDPEIDRVWASYCGQVRAVIEALRKPSSTMLRAAAAAMSSGKRPTQRRVSVRLKHAIRYRAMIGAILDDESES